MRQSKTISATCYLKNGILQTRSSVITELVVWSSQKSRAGDTKSKAGHGED